MTHSLVQTAFTSLAVTAATLVSGVVLARLLGPDARGAYGAALFWAQFAVSLGTFSLYEAAVVRLRGSGESGASQLSSLLVAAGCLSIGCFALVSLAHLAGIVRVPDVSSTTFLAFALAAQVIGHYSFSFIAIESAELRFGRLNLDRVASPVVFTAACLALYIADIASVPAVLYVFALAHSPVLILRFWRHRAVLRGRVDTAFLRSTAALGVRFHASAALGLVAAEADRLIVVSLWPEDLFGYYFVAVSATGAGFALLASSLRLVLLPSLAGMEPHRRRPSVERLLRVTLAGSVLSASALYIAAPTLVPLVYGSAFAPAADYVQGLLLPMMLLPCISVVSICNRSAERGWPSLEMGLVSLLAFVGGYAATGFATAADLFATMALANVLAILSGMRHLADHGDIRWSRAILPFPSDVRFLHHQLSQLMRHRGAAYVR
ncbi:MAG TPA: oligosaccharide flippase family protein [Aestuariivirgaceae bacterium]|nr:oligosaccharide flippase family protein [Aestuariivirgaceae bacterium]